MSDLINRQDAIDAINHICPIETEYDCTLLDRMDVRYVLSELPSAERKRGEWIVKGQEVYCSKCKKISGYNWHGASAFSKFCPNCGADMRGDND